MFHIESYFYQNVVGNKILYYNLFYQKYYGGEITINNLKSIRNERKLTGSEVAEYLNISVSFYYSLEAGRKTLTQEYLEKLSDFYGVSIDYLLGRTAIEEINPETANELLEVKKVDPDLFTEMCRAKDLPEEDRKKVREYAAMLIEKRLRDNQKNND